MIKSLYNKKQSGYYENLRPDIIALIPDGSNKILELGCAKGYTLKKLKELGKASEILGIEINRQSVLEAKNHLDNVICANIEDMVSIPFNRNYFNFIIFADVLEHLEDPWNVLKMIRNYLKDDGFVIATIPNLRHKSIILPLFLRGRFQYDPTGGAMDISHLRFFTRESITTMFKSVGYSKVTFIDYPLSLKAKIVTLLSFGFLRDFFIFKFRVKVEK